MFTKRAMRVRALELAVSHSDSLSRELSITELAERYYRFLITGIAPPRPMKLTDRKAS